MTREESLAGGMDDTHVVVRVGDTVRRPVARCSGAVRALLRHLQQVGFDGAPRHLGSDEQGREVFSYVDGQVPRPPYPAWSMTDAAVTDVGHLLRRLHEATTSFDLTGISGWSDEWGDPVGGPVVCHNDLFPENVVFRDDRPVALIDFDMAAPGRALWDVAIAAQEWGPLHAPDTRLNHPRHLDGVARLGLLARGYGVEPDHASELVSLIFEEREHSLAHIRNEIAEGSPGWVENRRRTRGEERATADDAWLERHRTALVEAAAGRRPRST